MSDTDSALQSATNYNKDKGLTLNNSRDPDFMRESTKSNHNLRNLQDLQNLQNLEITHVTMKSTGNSMYIENPLNDEKDGDTESLNEEQELHFNRSYS